MEVIILTIFAVICCIIVIVVAIPAFIPRKEITDIFPEDLYKWINENTAHVFKRKNYYYDLNTVKTAVDGENFPELFKKKKAVAFWGRKVTSRSICLFLFSIIALMIFRDRNNTENNRFYGYAMLLFFGLFVLGAIVASVISLKYVEPAYKKMLADYETRLMKDGRIVIIYANGFKNLPMEHHKEYGNLSSPFSCIAFIGKVNKLAVTQETVTAYCTEEIYEIQFYGDSSSEALPSVSHFAVSFSFYNANKSNKKELWINDYYDAEFQLLIQALEKLK